MSESIPESLTVAVVQLCSTEDTAANMQRVVGFVQAAFEAGAKLVALPENFGFLGPEAAKLVHVQSPADGPFITPLADLARRFQGSILAGSIPETGPDATHAYNTSVLLDATGAVQATYRKIHLFDVDVPEARYRESAHVAAGSDLVLTPCGGFTLGMSVCYDLRFPELYRKLSLQGADVLCVPAAFTLQTGKDHWEVLLRSRAIENQAYVIAPGQWGRHGGPRISWGKSMIIDPWGIPLATHPEGEGFVLARLERQSLQSIRRQLPALTHRQL